MRGKVARVRVMVRVIGGNADDGVGEGEGEGEGESES